MKKAGQSERVKHRSKRGYSRSMMGPFRSTMERTYSQLQSKGAIYLLTKDLRSREGVGQEALMVTATSRSEQRKFRWSSKQHDKRE